MAWSFPDEAPFDMAVGTDSFMGCRLIALDGEHLTFEFEEKCNQGRYQRQRGQVKLEDVKAIWEDAVSARLREERAFAPDSGER